MNQTIYKCLKCGDRQIIFTAFSKPTRCSSCGSTNIVEDGIAHNFKMEASKYD